MQTLQGHLITFTLKLVPIKVPIFQVIEAKLFLSEWKLDKSWESSWITMSKPEISIYCLRWHQILKLQNVRMNPLCLNFKSFNLDGRWASSFWNIRSEPNEQQQQIWEGRASISRKHVLEPCMKGPVRALRELCHTGALRLRTQQHEAHPKWHWGFVLSPQRMKCCYTSVKDETFSVLYGTF